MLNWSGVHALREPATTSPTVNARVLGTLRKARPDCALDRLISIRSTMHSARPLQRTEQINGYFRPEKPGHC
jgi:hypothetical protein